MLIVRSKLIKVASLHLNFERNKSLICSETKLRFCMLFLPSHITHIYLPAFKR